MMKPGDGHPLCGLKAEKKTAVEEHDYVHLNWRSRGQVIAEGYLLLTK